jgi:hypothetical protein
MLSEKEMTQGDRGILEPARGDRAGLVNQAVERGGPDNATAVVFIVDAV